MSVYRVRVPVEFIVEINEENALADHRPLLQGDLPLVAVRRALMSLFKTDREYMKRNGVKRIIVRKAARKIQVVTLEPGTRSGK